MKHFPEFKEFVNKEEETLNNTPGGDTQLLVMYHRLPYEMKEVDGKEQKVSPKSPNGIIPSLLGFFSNGRSGSWIAWEEVRNKNISQPEDRYIDEKKISQPAVHRG